MFEFDIGSTRMSLDKATLRPLSMSESFARPPAALAGQRSPFLLEENQIERHRAPAIPSQDSLWTEAAPSAPAVDLISSRHTAERRTTGSFGTLSGSFDLMAFRPGNGGAAATRSVQLAAPIWAAAIVFSLLLHSAGFLAALTWPAPAVTPPEAIPVEIVLEPPTATADQVLRQEPPTPVAEAPSSTTTLPVPEVATPEPLPADAPRSFSPPPETPAASPSPIAPSSLSEAAPVAPSQKTSPDPTPEAAPLAAEPPPSPVATPPEVTAEYPSALSSDAPPLALAPPPIETPAVVEFAPPSVPSTPEPQVSVPPIAGPEAILVAAPPIVEPPAPPATSAGAPSAKAHHSPIAAPASSAPPIRQPAKPRAEALRKPIARAPTGASEPKSTQPAPATAKAASSGAAGADVAGYQRAVAARISAMKRYPEAARDRAPHGVAVVRFSIGATGQAAGLSIAQSAGDAILDAEALATVRRASPFSPPPPGAPASFLAPLSFKIR
jgi:periplasmic protein TonB